MDQKVIDYLFLNINDAYDMSGLIRNVGYNDYSFNLSQNVVEHIFDLFIMDGKRRFDISGMVNNIILNDKITFISNALKQNQNQKQIRLDFIEMYLRKIKGNKELIKNGTLNSFFKYFDDSLETKKAIANKLMDYGFKFNWRDQLGILCNTEEKDREELEYILSKNPESKITEPQTYPQEDIQPTDSTQKESFFNWIIYCAIALIIFIAVLFFVFKEPLILFALLAPIIIFVYRFIERCKKNNPEQEKPNLKTNDEDEKISLINRTQNINLDEQNPDEKIILDENTNSEGYDNNLEEN